MKHRIMIVIIVLLGVFFYDTQNSIAREEKVILKAKVLEFDGESSIFSAKGNVNILYKKLKIWAKKSSYSKNSKKLEAIGRVIAKQNNMTLYCNHLKALLKKDSIEAEGKVKLLFLDYVGTAEKLIYDMEKEKAFLLGNPKVTQGKDSINAEKIIMNFRTNTIQTKGKTKIKVIPKDKGEEA